MMNAKFTRIVPLAMVAAIVTAYLGSFGVPLLLDDRASLCVYTTWESLWPSRLATRSAVNVTFVINFLLGNGRAADYHLVNLALHVSAALLLYGIVRRTLSAKSSYGFYETEIPWFAGIAALVWAVHPLQVQSVTYLCQRYESMMGTCFLLSLYGLVRASTNVNPRLWTGISITFCLVGMASKEVMIIAPVILFLYDGVFLSSGFRDALKVRWKTHVAYLLTVGIVPVLWIGNRMSEMASGADMFYAGDRLSYLLTQPGVVLHYLRLAVVPYPLCFDYDWPLVQHAGEAFWPGLLVGMLLLGIVCALRKRRPIGFLGAAFFLLLSPSSSFRPLPDIAFEHRMYLPLAAIAVLAAATARVALRRLAGNRDEDLARSRRIGALLGTTCILILWSLTCLRNADFASEEVVWRDVVSKRPANLRARNDLAAVLCERGAYEEAAIHLGVVLDRTGHLPQGNGSAVPYTLSSNSDQHNRCRALTNLGILELNLGRPEAARRHFEDALRVYPYYHEAIFRLNWLEKQVGAGRKTVESIP